jgi:Ulp1 family protease
VVINLIRIAKYPIQGTGGVSITVKDFSRLGPEEFLNDTLIEYGLRSVNASPARKDKDFD